MPSIIKSWGGFSDVIKSRSRVSAETKNLMTVFNYNLHICYFSTSTNLCCLGVVLPSCLGVPAPGSLFFSLAQASAAFLQSIGSAVELAWGLKTHTVRI